MNKLKIILTATLAAVLTLSCSSGDDEGSSGGSGPITESFTLKDVTADQFTYVEVEVYDRCEEGGVLKIEVETYEETVKYSIKNNIMTWSNRWAEDTLNFKGTSNELIGTWTRTKDKNASCGPRTERYCTGGGHWDYETDEWVCERYEEDTWNECKSGYDITKAVITATTIAITRDECRTDEMTERTYNGWTRRVVNCDTYEMVKGSDKVTVRETRANIEISYKGKSCRMSEPSKAQKEAACREAWNKYHLTDNYWDDYYWDILEGDFEACLKRILPPELMGGGDDYDDYNSYGKVAAKPLAKAKAKAKFAPLLEK